ncbi:hypothetical protein N7527_006372 [Penicillium freii]|nr:hypothetical protein N7527_006372 [Penicillium freii]KAJ5961686.1 hypothetical protein N7501_006627 [Penicillium viridicatum]
MDDDFNSSDVDFGPPETDKRGRAVGQESIDQIIQNSAVNRLASKKRVKQLQFGYGAPSYRFAQDLWVRRFNTYRQHTLRQDLTIPFTGEDLIRFFDSVIDIVKPIDTGKPVPNVSLVNRAFKILLAYGEFTWTEGDGFQISRHDGRRLQSFLDDAVKAGRLIKGSWRKCTWIGFATLSRMVRAFVERCLDKGCSGWDVAVAKCLSITLVSALGCRSGDVAFSTGYTGEEYLQYRHIELTIDGHAANFHNIRAAITLESVKGHKDALNENFVRFLRPLDDVECAHVCPITWLLVHSLRNGLVYGTTLPEVLNRAFDRADRRIEWTQPSFPVLAAFTHGPTRCDLPKPALIYQLLRTIKEMGLISNILSRVYMHATRLGAIRDIAHLPRSNESFGYTTDEHRQILMHKPSSINRGVTEKYIGDTSQELYNDRAANRSKVHRREPRFASTSAVDVVNAPVTEQEIHEWQERNARQGQAKRRLQAGIRRERLASFIENAEPEDISKQKPEPRQTSLVALAARSASAINARRSSPSVTVPTDSRIPTDPNIDPALFDNDLLEQTSVPAADINLLQTTLFLADEPGEATEPGQIGHNDCTTIDEEADRLLLGGDGGTNADSAESFIKHYSQINVVRSEGHGYSVKWAAYLANKSKDDTIDSIAMRGNSRDDPTPYMHRCEKTPNCSYQTDSRSSMVQHERTCSKHLVELRQKQEDVSSCVKCPYEGCSRTFLSRDAMLSHKKGAHDWVPQPWDTSHASTVAAGQLHVYIRDAKAARASVVGIHYAIILSSAIKLPTQHYNFGTSHYLSPDPNGSGGRPA